MPEAQYPKEAQIQSFYRQLIGRLQQLPGMQMAGTSTDLPLRAGWNHIFTPEGYQPPPGANLNFSNHSVIFAQYLQTMGVPLLKGRYFTEADKQGSTPVLLVSESLAKRYWPNQDAIGKRLQVGSAGIERSLAHRGGRCWGRKTEHTGCRNYSPYLRTFPAEHQRLGQCRHPGRG